MGDRDRGKHGCLADCVPLYLYLYTLSFPKGNTT